MLARGKSQNFKTDYCRTIDISWSPGSTERPSQLLPVASFTVEAGNSTVVCGQCRAQLLSNQRLTILPPCAANSASCDSAARQIDGTFPMDRGRIGYPMNTAKSSNPQRRQTGPGRRWPFGEIGTVAHRAIVGWFEHNDSSMGAALAFYTLFSIAPILIIAMAVAGYVFGPQVAETQVLEQLSALIGDTGAKAIRDLLLSAHYSDQKGFAAAIGIATLLVGATSVFGELQYTLDRIWNTPKENSVVWWQLIRTRILSIGLVLGVGFLLLVSLVASAALTVVENILGSFMTGWGVILPVIDLTLSFAMTTLLFGMIYKYIPRERLAWSDVWIGAAVTAFLFTVGKFLIGIYLGKSSFSSAYGATGSLVVLLLWIYYSAQIFLLGAEFTRVVTYEYGSRHSTVRA